MSSSAPIGRDLVMAALDRLEADADEALALPFDALATWTGY